MEGVRETEKEQLCGGVDDTVFVAVGKNVKESKSTLVWALQSFRGKKIRVLHVHQPTHVVSLMDGKFSANKLKQQVVKAFRELERQNMHKLLNQYLVILAQEGVQADKVWIDMDNIEKGITEIIARHDIRWLVMGAAADKHYSQRMAELKSNKAIFVCQEAPISCHIWFACKGHLIYTRGGRKDETDIEIAPALLQLNHIGTEESEHLRSKSIIDRQRSLDRLSNLDRDCIHRERSVNFGSHVGNMTALSSPKSNRETTMLLSCANAEKDANEWEGIPTRFTSQCSGHSTWSSKMVGASKSTPLLEDEEDKIQGRATSKTYDRLERAMMDAEISKQAAFEESLKRWKAEEDAMEAICKAKASESLCTKEMSQRKEMEEVLAREKQELERMTNQRDEFMKELRMVQDQMSVLETRIAESHCNADELEEKIISAVELLIILKEKRDAMRIEHGNAIREVEALRKLAEQEAASLCRPQLFAFSFLEINEATQDFDPSWKIGEGSYGSVYKGFLRHLQVAIKMLPSYGSQGHLDFQHELEVLSRVRHPNLVTLIGACLESRSLIYEYLQNGSLEDRLACRNNTPPLLWQTRTHIATELCSALIFLHSNNPYIVHGNLKPTKVLLDANFVCKLGDFGIFRLIRQDENPTNTITLCNKTSPMVTSVYMDPDVFETGELTPESDVYSFGIILLRLLTGRPPLGIVKDVKCALEKENLNAVMDFSAGEWPLEHAKQLAHLALRCCETNRLNRPDLVSAVWSVLEPMTDSCMASASCLGSKEHRRIPSHFLCPIFQEVMKDPHIAADGFTYEAEAIKGWLNSGHNTSPMTNLKLPHCKLLPNYALHYAIQGWQQQS